jgi:hypothetical protein
MSPEDVMAGRIRSAIGLGLALSVGPGCTKEKVTSPTPLAIQCSANPTTGAAPLTVAFGLDVANAVGSVTLAITYGDGQSGTDLAARHVYGSAGDYMAQLAVTAGVESARCSVPITVQSAALPSPSPSPSVPNPPGNQNPIASFKTTPEGSTLTGKAPFTVQFNMCRSVDPDGDRMLFRMDLDGNGSFEFLGSSGADCRHDATYAVGTYTATICVTDVNCPSWPLCNADPPLHPYQCASYSITAVP